MSACALPLLMLNIQGNIVFIWSSAKNTSAEKRNTDIVNRNGFVWLPNSKWLVTGVGIYISRENHNRSFCTGKKLENVPGPKLGRAQCKFGPQHPSQSLAESNRKGSFVVVVDKMEGYEERYSEDRDCE